VPERLFSQIGYPKTTVGDIAKELRMSPPTSIAFSNRKRRFHWVVAQGLANKMAAFSNRLTPRLMQRATMRKIMRR
jgi:AcrR family transcriptional regulator